MIEISAGTAEALGWRGTARMIHQPIGSRPDRERFMTAITDYAGTLGLEVFCSPDRDYWQVKTGTPEMWLAADKLCAYAMGLSDALSGDYGQPWSLARGPSPLAPHHC